MADYPSRLDRSHLEPLILRALEALGGRAERQAVKVTAIELGGFSSEDRSLTSPKPGMTRLEYEAGHAEDSLTFAYFVSYVLPSVPCHEVGLAFDAGGAITSSIGIAASASQEHKESVALRTSSVVALTSLASDSRCCTRRNYAERTDGQSGGVRSGLTREGHLR